MICAEDGCDTVLSIYNPGRYCALHEGRHEYPSTVRWATTGQQKHSREADRQRRYRTSKRREQREAS